MASPEAVNSSRVAYASPKHYPKRTVETNSVMTVNYIFHTPVFDEILFYSVGEKLLATIHN